jgi:hypothetical protein
VCRSCGLISENPPVEAVCLSCGAHTPADDLVSTIIFRYILTSRGAAAVRRGSLFDEDDELLSVADAPFYRRKVILQFLDHEMKRVQLFHTTFSVLLASCSASNNGDNDDASRWLTDLRRCLREVDLIGQLADSLYIVVLPQTKRHEAEALRQRIAAEFGLESPVTLSTFEITEQRHLSRILAGLTEQGEPS